MTKKETNRERFVRIAEARTQKIIDMIDLLAIVLINTITNIRKKM